MKLPNGASAIIPMEKLVGYCLNPNHSSGKHKARVFASALGIQADNAEDLRQLIAQAAVEGEVVQQGSTEDLRQLIAQAAVEGEVVQQGSTAFGQLYKVDWVIIDRDSVVLRTLWEVRTGQSAPRLVSAFIK